MILDIIRDFQPKLKKVLGSIQREKTYYNRLHMASTILRQVEAMQSAMANLMDKLARALPVCGSPLDQFRRK